jgi:hypothetical protein
MQNLVMVSSNVLPDVQSFHFTILVSMPECQACDAQGEHCQGAADFWDAPRF